MENLIELLIEHKLVTSKGEARKLIAGNAVRVEDNVLKVSKTKQVILGSPQLREVHCLENS